MFCGPSTVPDETLSVSVDDVWLPGSGNHDVNSLSVVVATVVVVVGGVVVGAGVVIGLSVHTTQVSRLKYNIGRHGLRKRLEISETNLKQNKGIF